MERVTPFLHFASKTGWINDPNGLVYHDGQYELYYQHNPDGYVWNDMHWGHAVSTDLLHWQDLPMAMEPDETGMMYSGCALMNTRGMLGLPKSAIIYYYTAAGHMTELSRNRGYEILWAYSLDGGRTITKTGEKVLEAPAWENRDPAVFYHEPTHAYILVIWVEKNDFAIYRSEDMRHFTMSQRLTLQGGYECPDLFCLPVRNMEGKPTGESKWVFWNGDSSYFVGSFDGYQFTPEQFPRYAYTDGKMAIPYAAQTWSDDPKGRILQTAWVRTENVAAKSTGVMSIPRELSLVCGEIPDPHLGGVSRMYTLKMDLPEEVTSQLKPLGTVSADSPSLTVPDQVLSLDFALEGSFDLQMKDETGEVLLMIRYLPDTGSMLFYYRGAGKIIPVGQTRSVNLLYDRGIIEASWDNSCCTHITDIPQNRLCAVHSLTLTAVKDGAPRIEVSVL